MLEKCIRNIQYNSSTSALQKGEVTYDLKAMASFIRSNQALGETFTLCDLTPRGSAMSGGTLVARIFQRSKLMVIPCV